MPKNFNPGNIKRNEFDGISIEKESPKENPNETTYKLKQVQDGEKLSNKYFKANDRSMDGYYVWMTKCGKDICLWPISKKTMFNSVAKDTEDIDAIIAKTYNLMKRRKGKKKEKKKMDEEDNEDKDSLSELVNKESDNEFDGEFDDFGMFGKMVKKKEIDGEPKQGEEFKEMDNLVKRSDLELAKAEDDFSDTETDEEDDSSAGEFQ